MAFDAVHFQEHESQHRSRGNLGAWPCKRWYRPDFRTARRRGKDGGGPTHGWMMRAYTACLQSFGRCVLVVSNSYILGSYQICAQNVNAWVAQYAIWTWAYVVSKRGLVFEIWGQPILSKIDLYINKNFYVPLSMPFLMPFWDSRCLLEGLFGEAQLVLSPLLGPSIQTNTCEKVSSGHDITAILTKGPPIPLQFASAIEPFQQIGWY